MTRWFYGEGWTGINVEPNPAFLALLKRDRPHDLNLPVAIAGKAGEVELHLLDGLSTIEDAVASRHRDSGRDVDQTAKVDAITLGQLLDRHCQGRVIDFLKIDAPRALRASRSSTHMSSRSIDPEFWSSRRPFRTA